TGERVSLPAHRHLLTSQSQTRQLMRLLWKVKLQNITHDKTVTHQSILGPPAGQSSTRQHSGRRTTFVLSDDAALRLVEAVRKVRTVLARNIPDRLDFEQSWHANSPEEAKEWVGAVLLSIFAGIGHSDLSPSATDKDVPITEHGSFTG